MTIYLQLHFIFELAIDYKSEVSFEPQLLRKNLTRLTTMDDQILTLYAKVISSREIVQTYKEMYDDDVFPTVMSKDTLACMPVIERD